MKDKFLFNLPIIFFLLFALYIFNFYPPLTYLKSTAKHDINNGDSASAFVPIMAQEITNHHQTNSTTNQLQTERENCDLFKGKWVVDVEGPLYKNSSCKITYLDCFLHGRRDRDFLHWRWKPDHCELHRFDPRSFLDIVKGKTLAFIGDSLSRNQIESLLCLLSLEEAPVEVYKDTEDRFNTWQFPRHNFTIRALWSQFLVAASEIIINGSATGGFHLHLDKVDYKWAQNLPEINYAIFSGAHWFFRPNYLYEDGKLVGCVYCNSKETNLTDLGPGYAIRRAFRTAFNYVNDCENCSAGIVSFLRTYSPSHFENGSWNSGGSCNRTSPVIGEDNNGYISELRNIQIEEIEGAKKEGKKRFEVLDITRAMEMRADGHPGLHWRNKWMKGYSDCLHWCLPGPIDTWNQLLFEMIKRQTNFLASTHPND